MCQSAFSVLLDAAFFCCEGVQQMPLSDHKKNPEDVIRIGEGMCGSGYWMAGKVMTENCARRILIDNVLVS